MFIFIFFVSNYYFSEHNIVYINKSRANYVNENAKDLVNLPLLKNNTNDSIYYINEIEIFKKMRKKRFWENLITNFNE